MCFVFLIGYCIFQVGTDLLLVWHMMYCAWRSSLREMSASRAFHRGNLHLVAKQPSPLEATAMLVYNDE